MNTHVGNMKKDNLSAKKWQIPVMQAEPNRVMRSQSVETSLQNAASSIPTVEEVAQWRNDAEAEGFKAGMEKAQTSLRAEKLRLQQLVTFFQQPLQALNEEVEQQLYQLAVTLAQQLVRREIRIDPGEIVGLIRDSVKLLPSYSRDIVIHINPEDAGLLRSALSLDHSGEMQGWKLIEDPMMSRGGCQIQSASSVINLQLENRLAALAAAVFGDARGGKGGENG